MQRTNKVSAELLHRQECQACPLNRAKVYSPKIQPSGPNDGLIYVLGAAPNERADDDNRPISGPDLAMIRRNVPKAAFLNMRFNTAIRCHPGSGKRIDTKDEALEIYETKAPQFVELECCRPSIVKDIERTKPVAIFSFGSIPLNWTVMETHPHLWQGRRIPVRVGSHECWLYPFVEPNFLFKDRRWEGHVGDSEIAFQFYINRAAEEVLGGKLPAPDIHSVERVKRGVVCVDGSEGRSHVNMIEDFLHDAARESVNGLDYETNALRPYNKDAVFLSKAVSYGDKSMSWAFDHREAKWTRGERAYVWDLFHDYLRDKRPLKAVHQLAFELEWTGVKISEELIHGSRWADTISQAYVINETQGLLAMEALTVQHYGFNIKELSPVDRRNLAAEPLSKLLPYNAIDSKYHRELYFTQDEILREDGMLGVYEHQVRRIPALVLTQIEGVPIDQNEVKDFRKEYDEDAEAAMDLLQRVPSVVKWQRQNGKEFEPANSHHFASLLKQIGIKLEKTDKGGDATSVKKINQYAKKDPAIELVWRWRKAKKVLSTYMDAVTPGSEYLFEDNRAHPIISATKVETWRTSSEDPNIQNWPKRNENAKVRRCVKQETYKVVSFDYAGIQGRNVAMESRDRRLTQHFIDGYDIHTDWLMRWHKICPAWFTKGWDRKDEAGKKIQKGHRHGMKNQFVFPSFFGARPSETMCANLQATGEIRPKPSQCAALQEEFFDEFPEIAIWHEKLHRDYPVYGYVTGLSGHRRHAPVSHNQIINSPIQADESKIVMAAHIALSEYDWTRYQPAMMIHDDLTFLWHTRDIEKRAEIVIEEMTRVRFDWVNPLPLEVEMSVGNDWASTEEVGAFQNVYDDGRAGFKQLKGKPLFG